MISLNVNFSGATSCNVSILLIKAVLSTLMITTVAIPNSSVLEK